MQRPAGRPAAWRVRSTLFTQGAAREIAYLTRHAQGWRERVRRRAGVLLTAPVRYLLRFLHPRASARLHHAFLRGMSRDRLRELGAEFAATVQLVRPDDADPVLVTPLLDEVARPLARRLGVRRYLCNRLEYRDGRATGRLREPIVPARGALLDDARFRDAVRDSDAPPRPRRRAVVGFGTGPGTDPLSVPGALHDRAILLVGGTGFIGKVWLAHLLREAPGVRVHLLVRPRNGETAPQRFAGLLRASPVLAELPEEDVLRRVRVYEGDMTKPGLGLAPEARDALAADTDVVVNSGGITEFNPDLRAALVTNVDATLHVLDFARAAGAPFLHLSTCYVAGRWSGFVEERLSPRVSPSGAPFDAAAERTALHALVAEAENGAERSRLRQRLMRLGTERAAAYGWPNTYTFTKALAESLVAERAGDLPFAVVRPSIVETSTTAPFPGWNEGVNTSAPLAYLLGTAFRQLPASARKRLDLVPVDEVARGMSLVTAALLTGRHQPLYHLATSHANPCDMERCIELTGLAHRRHYRAAGRPMRAFFDTIPVDKSRYRALSAPGQRRILRSLAKALPFVRRPLRRAERSLERVEKLIELYEPFILEHDHVFETTGIELLTAALPPEDRARFGFDPQAVDWAEYWLDVHVPALRRWSYPVLERRPAEA